MSTQVTTEPATAEPAPADSTYAASTREGSAARARSAAHVSPLQRFFDPIIVRTVLWAIPLWMRPNHLTVVRLLTVPPLAFLLLSERLGWAALLFVLSASTDFIDGALARNRDQITDLGIFLDPFADKLLVGTLLLSLGRQYLIIKLIVAFLAVELVVMAAFALSQLSHSRPMLPANTFGKIKMLLQVLGGALFLGARLAGQTGGLVTVSLYLLWAALVFAALSAALQVYGARRATA